MISPVLKELSMLQAPPATELRQFYEFLRDSTKRHVLNPLHEMMCPKDKEVSPEGVTLLAKLFERSCSQFGDYNNCQEPFRPDTRGEHQASPNFAPKFVATLREQWSGILVNNRTPQLRFVDREISPRRTTGVADPHSGAGGLDFLAVTNDDSRLPVVGEVKADNDETPLFALVQALTYTSEFVTDSQLKRLRVFYRDKFGTRVDGPQIEICLVVERSRSTEKKRRYDAVCKLAKELIRRDELGRVRSIQMWWGAEDSGKFKFDGEKYSK